MARSQARVWLSLLVLALCAVPASAEVFHVTLNNGSVIDTAYQPEQASWDPNMVLLLSDTGNWIGFPKEEIESIQAEDPTQGFGVRISDNTIALGLSPNDLPVPDENGRQAESDRYYALAERALALSEKQQTYSIQQGVQTEQTQGIPATFGGYSGSFTGGLNGGGFGGGGGLTPGPVTPPDSTVTPPNPNG